MALSAHRLLFSLIVLAALVGFGWVLVIYVLSFHAAQWLIDKIEPRREVLRPARRAVPRTYSRRYIAQR